MVIPSAASTPFVTPNASRRSSSASEEFFDAPEDFADSDVFGDAPEPSPTYSATITELPPTQCCLMLLSKSAFCSKSLDSNVQRSADACFQTLQTEIIGAGTRGQKFMINFSQKIASWEDEHGQQQSTVLEGLTQTNPSIKTAWSQIQQVFSKVLSPDELNPHEFSADYKGTPDRGFVVFDRSNPALKDLPVFTDGKAFEVFELCQETDANKREKLLHRLMQAQAWIQRLHTELVTQISSPTIAAVDKKRLEAEKTRLESVDTYALYLALLFYPVQDAGTTVALQDVQKQADALHDAVAKIVANQTQQATKEGKGGEVRSWGPKALRGKKAVPFDPQYARAVGGILFSGLERTVDARSGYLEYCKEHEMPVGSAGLEDYIVQEIIRTSSKNPRLEEKFGQDAVDRVRREIAAINVAGVSPTVADLRAAYGV